MHGQKTLFIEIIMGVILGAVLLAIADVLTQNLSRDNFQAVLLTIALLIFAEMFLGLRRYHIRLEEDYANFYLYFDILLGLIFVAFVELIRQSVTTPAFLAPAMLICAVVFVALGIRNIIPYKRIQDLETKLAQERIEKSTLLVPIYFNGVGVVACLCMYLAVQNDAFLGLTINTWVWIGLFVFILYVIAMNITRSQIKFSLR
jgi:hypothetical protein